MRKETVKKVKETMDKYIDLDEKINNGESSSWNRIDLSIHLEKQIRCVDELVDVVRIFGDLRVFVYKNLYGSNINAFLEDANVFYLTEDVMLQYIKNHPLNYPELEKRFPKEFWDNSDTRNMNEMMALIAMEKTRSNIFKHIKMKTPRISFDALKILFSNSEYVDVNKLPTIYKYSLLEINADFVQFMDQDWDIVERALFKNTHSMKFIEDKYVDGTSERSFKLIEKCLLNGTGNSRFLKYTNKLNKEQTLKLLITYLLNGGSCNKRCQRELYKRFPDLTPEDFASIKLINKVRKIGL